MKYVDFLNQYNAGAELCFSPCFKNNKVQKAIATKNGIHGVIVFKDVATKISAKLKAEMTLDKDNKIVWWLR